MKRELNESKFLQEALSSLVKDGELSKTLGTPNLLSDFPWPEETPASQHHLWDVLSPYVHAEFKMTSLNSGNSAEMRKKTTAFIKWIRTTNLPESVLQPQLSASTPRMEKEKEVFSKMNPFTSGKFFPIF